MKTDKLDGKGKAIGIFDFEKSCDSNRLLVNLRDIIQSHPDEIAVQFGMSIIHTFENQYAEMIECLESLIQKFPDIPLLHRRIAEVFIGKNNFEKAIPHLEKVINLDEENMTAQVWLTLSYYKIGEKEKADSKLIGLQDQCFTLHFTKCDWL